MSLQRSEQKGRQGLAEEYSISLPQVGHLTFMMFFDQEGVQSPRRNGISSVRARCSLWFSSGREKRIQSMYLLALTSGTTVLSAGSQIWTRAQF